MSDLRTCPARMYEHACELRYDHDGNHRHGAFTWERLEPPSKAETDAVTCPDGVVRHTRFVVLDCSVCHPECHPSCCRVTRPAITRPEGGPDTTQL